MSGLEPSVFRAQLRGQSLKFLAVASAPKNAPARVVILVDLSGSATGVSKIASALAENIAVSSHLRPALVLFSDHIIDSVDFSHSPEEVVHKLAKLPETRGPTALFDALKYAADLFGAPLPGDSVYLISDGFENASKVLRAEVRREFLVKGIRIYTFCLQLQAPPMLNYDELGTGAACSKSFLI
jgi:Mg-chelatase subunit ChlD